MAVSGRLVFFILLIYMILQKVGGTKRNAQLLVSSSEKAETFCMTYDAQYKRLPASLRDAVPSVLVDLSQIHGCTFEEYPPGVLIANRSVVLLGGDCGNAQKANLALQMHVRSLLVIETKSETKCFGNFYKNKDTKIAVASIPWNVYNQIVLHKSPIFLSMYAPEERFWVPSIIFIVVLSTALVMLSAGRVAFIEHKSRQVPDKQMSTDRAKQAKFAIDCWTVCLIAAGLAFSCAMIVLAYFFFNQMIYVIMGIYSVIGTAALHYCLIPIWSLLMPAIYEKRLNKLLCSNGKEELSIKFSIIVLYLLCLSLGIFWVVNLYASYAWVIKNVIIAAICMVGMELVRVRKFTTMLVILLLSLLLDVLLILLNLLITSDSKGILSKIVLCNTEPCSVTLTLSLAFWIPLEFEINDSPQACNYPAFISLGFQDIVIPGLIITYCAVFDVKYGTRMVYYVASSVGYLCGMIICMVALEFISYTQPTLVYLVPSTLIATVVVALARGELRKLCTQGGAQSNKVSCGKLEKELEEGVDKKRNLIVNVRFVQEEQGKGTQKEDDKEELKIKNGLTAPMHQISHM